MFEILGHLLIHYKLADEPLMRTPHGGHQLVGAKGYFPDADVGQDNKRFCQSKKKKRESVSIF